MYLVSRTASFAKLFFLISLFGLFMYAVLAFYTFHVALNSVTKSERIQKSLKSYPVPNTKEFVSEMKYILLWTIPDVKYKLIAEGHSVLIDNDCDYLNCYLTSNQSLLSDVTKFDSIVFSINTLRRWKKYLPKERSVKQKYVFYSMTSATEHPVCNVLADNYFNWTWTYKLYSDIPTPFIEVKDLKGNVIAPNTDVEWYDSISTLNNTEVKTKSKAIMWYKENCDTKQSDVFAKELKFYLKEHSLVFDIYGCGYKNCSKSECMKAIEEDYSFYLAYEDSLSDDYVTKEVLKGLQHNAVPVVIGGADYTKFLPPGSYIDARYETPERLAGLLEYIVRNPSTYQKYFNWKNYFTINEANIQKGFCHLCALLNNKKRVETHSTYENFRKWWYYGNLQEKCFPKGAESMDSVLSYIENAEVRKNYMP